MLYLNGTHGMNYHGYHLFTLIMWYPIMGSGYLIAFLISKYKWSSTLKKWLTFLK